MIRVTGTTTRENLKRLVDLDFIEKIEVNIEEYKGTKTESELTNNLCEIPTQKSATEDEELKYNIWETGFYNLLIRDKKAIVDFDLADDIFYKIYQVKSLEYGKLVAYPLVGKGRKIRFSSIEEIEEEYSILAPNISDLYVYKDDNDDLWSTIGSDKEGEYLVNIENGLCMIADGQGEQSPILSVRGTKEKVLNFSLNEETCINKENGQSFKLGDVTTSLLVDVWDEDYEKCIDVLPLVKFSQKYQIQGKFKNLLEKLTEKSDIAYY